MTLYFRHLVVFRHLRCHVLQGNGFGIVGHGISSANAPRAAQSGY
jgi:hypothetical protein